MEQKPSEDATEGGDEAGGGKRLREGCMVEGKEAEEKEEGEEERQQQERRQPRQRWRWKAEARRGAPPLVSARARGRRPRKQRSFVPKLNEAIPSPLFHLLPRFPIPPSPLLHPQLPLLLPSPTAGRAPPPIAAAPSVSDVASAQPSGFKGRKSSPVYSARAHFPHLENVGSSLTAANCHLQFQPSFPGSIMPFYPECGSSFPHYYPSLLPPLPSASGGCPVPWLVPPTSCAEFDVGDDADTTLSESGNDSGGPSKAMESKNRGMRSHMQPAKRDLEIRGRVNMIFPGENYHTEQRAQAGPQAGRRKGILKQHSKPKAIMKRLGACGIPANLLQIPPVRPSAGD